MLLVMIGCQSRTTGEVELERNDLKDSSGTVNQSLVYDTSTESGIPIMGEQVLRKDSIMVKDKEVKSKNVLFQKRR